MEQHIQRYTKYIHEIIQKMDLETATYQDLHKVFEWYGCIQLSRESGRVVLRWEDVPADVREEKGMSRDMGIDAWDRDGDRVVQMKLYSGLIGWRAFSTFWSACHTVFEDSEKILYRTAESTIHSLIQTSVQKGKLQDMTVTDAEFRGACRVIQKKRLAPPKEVAEEVVLRPYQVEAMVMMEKAKEEGRNLMVCLPTGTGKTVVTLQYHLAHGVPLGEKMLILVPTLVLMEQWSEACKRLGMKAYLIGTNQHRSLGEMADQLVVICVYDSFGGIAGETGRFGRIVIDEAHHVLVPERYQETEQEFEGSEDEDEDEEWEEEDKKRTVSYMSAIRSLAQTHQVTYLSATMDKPEDGSLFYEYKVRHAIQDGYLCDYEFVFPIFEREYETNQHLAEYLVHRQQETHCLIYASNRVEGKAFVDRLNTLQPGCAGYIDGTTRPASRKKIFTDFESGKIRFLVNIRVLVEGFDAPHIRSVFFLRVSSSDIFIIQAIGRALRLHADKIKARVYVPFTHEGDIDRIQAFLTQLASYDERVEESIRGKRVGGYVRVERGEAEAEGEEDGDDGDEKGDEKEEVFQFRYNLVVDRMGNSSGQLEAMALRRAEEYIALYHELGRRPSIYLRGKAQKESATYEQKREQRSMLWFYTMKSVKQGRGKWKLYPSVERALIEAFGENWWKKQDLESNSLKQCEDYIIHFNELGRHPIQCLSRKPKESATYEEKREHRNGSWMNFMKMAKKGTCIRKLYPSVERRLIEVFGEDWWKTPDLELKCMKYCENYIKLRRDLGRNLKRCLIGKIKSESVTSEQKIEHDTAEWFSRIRQSKQGKGTTILYPSVEGRLIQEYGNNWWKTPDLEQKSLSQCEDFIIQTRKLGHFPMRCLEKKKRKEKDSVSDDQILENQTASWFHHIKNAKKKKSTTKLYPSVEQKLINAFGEDWWKTSK